MQRPSLICLIGIDGSGKTTLAKALAEETKKSGLNYKYVWGNAQPIFLLPLRKLAHLTVLRNVDMKKENDRYDKVKEDVSTKYCFLLWIYSRVLLFDYVIWLFFKVKLPLFLGKKVICDRYIYDVAISLYFLNKSYFADIEKTINKLFNYFPKPELLYLIDVPVAVAFKRKNDIPSLAYLENRKIIYTKLSNAFNVSKLNGENSIEDLVKTIIQDMERNTIYE